MIKKLRNAECYPPEITRALAESVFDIKEGPCFLSLLAGEAEIYILGATFA